jgi:hypothetical protein
MNRYKIKIKLDNCNWDMDSLKKSIEKLFDNYNKRLVKTDWDNYCITYDISYKKIKDKR